MMLTSEERKYLEALTGTNETDAKLFQHARACLL